MVIAVDGQWGSGKSTFLRMWAGELRKRDIPVIYFDAFENDYLDDAFVAIASEIIELADERGKGDDPSASEFVEKAKGVLKILARAALKIGVKAATGGAVDSFGGDVLKDVSGDIAGEASGLADKHFGERLTKAKAQKGVIREFREALSSLSSLLTNSEVSEKIISQKPLIIIIDELDRCKPHFALEILERMKHFFAVPNIHFVLGVHLEQLRSSVRMAYGSGIDAHLYLQKFIHLSILLDGENDKYLADDFEKFLNRIHEQLHFNQEFGRTAELVKQIVLSVARHNRFSFRTLERIYSMISISLYMSKGQRDIDPPIVAGLCILKVLYPDLYKKARSASLRFTEIEEIFGFVNYKDNDYELNWSRDYWRYMTDPNADQEIIDRYSRRSFNRDLSSRLSELKFIARDVVERMQPN